MNRFVIAEPLRCIGCNTCLAACAQTHKEQGLQQHPRLAMTRTGDQTAPILCRQCEDAPCKGYALLTPSAKAPTPLS